MFQWLTQAFRRTTIERRYRTILRARYDAAVTNDDNRRHWAAADGLSANAANSPEVRRVLRNRSRYEAANNSYARGIINTLANDVIGTGPRLQMLSPNAEANRRIERAFSRWTTTIRLAEKLRTMRCARATDGESFALLTSNPRFTDGVQLDLRLVEADQITTPDLKLNMAVDGIVFDRAGNPVEYHLLREHPGGSTTKLAPQFDRVPAESMLHWFRVDRPGQARGIPDITPALPLFAQLRRFTLAVLAAAETAADFAGILYTDAPASGEADAAEPFEPIELEKRALVTMPGGWKMAQLQAEQPATTYAEFKREILNEIARCLNMPFKVGAPEMSFSQTKPRSIPQRKSMNLPVSSTIGPQTGYVTAASSDGAGNEKVKSAAISRAGGIHDSRVNARGRACMYKPDEPELQEPMSDAVASAWADVIISIHERSQAEKASEQCETHLGPGVVAGHGSTGGDLTSSHQEVQP